MNLQNYVGYCGRAIWAGAMVVSLNSVGAELSRVTVPQTLSSVEGGGGSSVLRYDIRLQEVYAARQFPSVPIEIREIRWRPSAIYGSTFTNHSPRLQVNLSTTLKNPGELSAVFAANVGGDDLVVFDGPSDLESQFSGPPSGPKSFDIVVPLSTPFIYNPEAGNLLVDIRNHNATGVAYVDAGVGGGFGSRVFALGANSTTGGADNGADAIQFGYVIAENPPPPPPAIVTRGPYLQSLTTSNVIVRWRTDRRVIGTVKYGTAVDAQNGGVGESAAAYDHTVTLENLAAGTRYYYSVISGTNSTLSGDDFHVTTAADGPGAIRIWAIGDSGTASIGSSAPRMVKDAYQQFRGEGKTDVWLMLGDNAYNWGTDNEYQAAVFDVFGDILKTTPVWSTLGNHETYAPDASGRIAYTDIFSFPQDGRAGGVPSGTERYYSFDRGNVHFVCLDSEISEKGSGSPMWVWLEADLEANTKDWTIAFWHSPPYSKGSHDSDTEVNLVGMREQALPILERHGVDLVLCGHSHSFERSHQLYGHYGLSSSLTSSMVVDANGGHAGQGESYKKGFSDGGVGTVYVVAGSAGQTSGGALNHPAMFVSQNRLGSMVIDVETNRLQANFLREDGTIGDDFTILKGDFPPSIVSAPSDKTAVAGDEVLFSVKATGMKPLSYQWYFGEAPIDGQTNASLMLPAVSAANAGFYHVRVTNVLGAVESVAVALAVTEAPDCSPISLPTILASAEGGGGSSVLNNNIRLQEVFSADQFPQHTMVIRELRWRPSAIYGSAFTATLPRLQINLSTTSRSPSDLSSTFAQNVGTDELVVRDGPITLTSTFAGPAGGPKAFDIVVPLEHPFPYDPSKGNLLVDIRNFGGGPVAYVDAGATAGRAARVFAIGANSTTATSGDSGADAIQICAAGTASPRPFITGQPESQSILVGATATFHVAVSGSEPLSYQWYRGQVALVGETGSTLVLANASPAMAGQYAVMVANTFGSVTSSVASLTVTYPTATVALGGGGVLAGGEIALPVTLAGNGVETVLSFSLQFDSARMAFVSAVAGVDLPAGSTVVARTDAATVGRVGIIITTPPDRPFLGGTSQVARVTMRSLAEVPLQPTRVEFADQPIERRLSVDGITHVSANYLDGIVSILPSVVFGRASDALGGSDVNVAFDLAALGVENAVGFSLRFGPDLILFRDATIGAGLPAGASLLLNTNLVGSGYLGLAVALPAGLTFDRGTQQLVTVRFRAAPVIESMTTTVEFATLPILSQISDVVAKPLPGVYYGATVRLTPSPLEGDAAPRPGGDRVLGIIDWVQVGRFATGLDEVTAEEFQRVDCAPRETLGNGVISVGDWVQAGRYSAGLDPASGVGGPTEPVEPGAGGGGGGGGGTDCIVSITTTNVLPGGTVTVPVRVFSSGAENAIGFTLAFDSAKLRFGTVTKTAPLANATLNVNTNAATVGRVGIAFALPAGGTLTPGTRDVLLVTFSASEGVSGQTGLSFADTPVLREAVSATARTISSRFDSAELVLGPPREVGPPLSIVRSGDSVVVFWSASPTGYELQSADAPQSASWSNVGANPIEIGGQKIVTLPRLGSGKFFRLRKP